jgi:GABA permease
VFVYVSIAVSQLRLRARFERENPARLGLRMWAYPYLTYLAIAAMLGILLAMAFIPDQRIPLLFGVISLGLLLLAFAARRRFGLALGVADPSTRPGNGSPRGSASRALHSRNEANKRD